MTETGIDIPAPSAAPARRARVARRSFWIRQTILWHWVSSGVCLGGVLLFTITGITLNHAGEITAKPRVRAEQATLPDPLRARLASEKREGKYPLPGPVAEWLSGRFGVRSMPETGEWSADEIYVSLPRPGGDAWLAIDRESGGVKFEKTDRGWISYLNDLHKGRHTGPAWQVFIDVLAAAFLVFTTTGLILLQTHAAKRPATWPLVLAGILLPVALMLLFVHR
jgi:hypothetical protein